MEMIKLYPECKDNIWGGTKLKEKSLSHFHIYGTLKDPIHAVNLKDTLKMIQKEF